MAHAKLDLNCFRNWKFSVDAAWAMAIRTATAATAHLATLGGAACALQFEQGRIGLYQIPAAKRHDGPIDLPLTRRELYRSTYG